MYVELHPRPDELYKDWEFSAVDTKRPRCERDGIRDFGVVLLTGREINDPKSRMHVIVFNGVKGGKYRVAHIEHEEFSKALFIGLNRHKLRVGVMETDSIGSFVPPGRGYTVEPGGT